MTEHHYESPEAFKQALETRIRRAALARRMDIGRFRQLLVFDRFLSRVFIELGQRVLVKGGVVLELRLERARTTRGVDLRLTGDPDTALGSLQQAGRLDLGDYLTFLVAPDPEHPTIDGDGVVYAGRRFRATAQLAGKLYGSPFGIDVSIGDVITVAPEVLRGDTFLDFVGATVGEFRVYPREAHVAEKLHAFTLPRPRENSRVKDLPDLGLLAMTGPFDGNQLRHALDETFAFRNTHAVPRSLPAAPRSWEPVYARMAKEDLLPWATLEDVENGVRAFLDPLLDDPPGTWSPANWAWV
ncbi:MAG: nucleotidyl transferase AbiEii/AbiGii toxin family protein [Myxococcaceae bacterium]